MSQCPYCEYATPEPDEGDAYVQGWQEVAHMQVAHPEVVAARLARIGVVDEPGFGWRDVV